MARTFHLVIALLIYSSPQTFYCTALTWALVLPHPTLLNWCYWKHLKILQCSHWQSVKFPVNSLSTNASSKEISFSCSRPRELVSYCLVLYMFHNIFHSPRCLHTLNQKGSRHEDQAIITFTYRKGIAKIFNTKGPKHLTTHRKSLLNHY